MKIITSTKSHKLWYQFPWILEFSYTPGGISEWGRWTRHFESRYGPNCEYKIFEDRYWSTPVYNTNWREERNSARKRLRIYVKEMKDITWAQLNLA